ncbi:MAG: (deoxy)nucleoside triphosphate pyrophosphohydrolase [Planctomycetaceae bacterium]|nr:(deoxy)nucleoside triphosphate pyrophosphohydrolase [Planctomycetaceae bacterium]
MTVTTHVGIAIVEADGKVLVGLRQSQDSLHGKAEFPGGKCEPGELPRACAVRECQEETSIVVLPHELLTTVTHQYEYGTVELHFWLCVPAHAASETSNPSGLFRWIPFSEMLKLDFPEGNREALRLLAERQQNQPS